MILNWKGSITIWLIWLLFFCLLYNVIINTPNEIVVSAKTIIVDDSGNVDFISIQDAINSANKGDTILIKNGTYNEQLTINKSISLIGENNETTIINGVININANWLNISGFTINYSSNKRDAPGIKLKDVSNCEISNCIISNHNNIGVLLYSSSSNKITNNLIINNRYGVKISCSSRYNIFNKNYFINDGISIYGSQLKDFYQHINISNLVNGKPIYYFRDKINMYIEGIPVGQLILVNCTNSRINNVIASNTDIGLELILSTNISISNSTFSYNQNGIYIEKSNYNKLINCNFSYNNDNASTLYRSNNNLLSNCKSYSNHEKGIYFHYSNENIIENCTSSFTEKNNGILISNSKNNIIKDCIFNWNNGDGIRLGASDNNKVIRNICKNNEHGIGLYCSKYNELNSNILYNCGIQLAGIYLYWWDTQHIDANNTVNNKPIYFWKNKHKGTIPNNAGQIILVNCSNILINNQNLSDCTIGIHLGWSNNNIISNNTCNRNDEGIYLWYSNNNKIINCTCNSNNVHGIFLKYSNDNTMINCTSNNNNGTDCGYGIGIYSSNNNAIFNCTCYLNKNDGIYIYNSNNNILSYNILTSHNYKFSHSGYGIRIHSTSNFNLIYQNNFINNNYNKMQCKDDGFGNKWNLTGKGNYWSEWITPDNNGNGIVDNPYFLDGDTKSKDYFPLTYSSRIIFYPPKITTKNILIAYVDQIYSVNYSASDLDTPTEDLIWKIETNASDIIFSLKNELFWIPTKKDIGIYWIKISVSDGTFIDFTYFEIYVIEKHDNENSNNDNGIKDKIDSDNDAMPDWYEKKYGFNKSNASDSSLDFDNDLLPNFSEYLIGTNPKNRDTDNDGLPDGWEVKYNIDPINTNDSLQDPDGDKYSNLEEFMEDTDPNDENEFPYTKKTEPKPMDYTIFIIILIFIIIILIIIIKIKGKKNKNK